MDKCSPKSPPGHEPDFSLDGVQQLVFKGLNAITKKLIAEHRWSRTRAVEWVQIFLRKARVQLHSAAKHDEHDAFEASMEGKKKKVQWRVVLRCGCYTIMRGYRELRS